MGTALAQLIASNGHAVALWNHDPKLLERIAKTRQSSFLRGIKLHKDIVPVSDLAEVVESAEVVFLTVSSPYVRKVAAELAAFIDSRTIVVSSAKGIEIKSGLTMAEVVARELKSVNRRRLTVLSGPSLADEFVRGVPTGVVLASPDRLSAKQARRLLENQSFKVEISSDVVGVALCGALKNVYSVMLGLCEGLGYKMNAKALVATLALKEMEALVKAAGGKAETVGGLAGHGDLMVTAFGKSRNRQFGKKLAKCKSCQNLLEGNTQTIEGLETAAAAAKLARKHKLVQPLLHTAELILFKNKPPARAVEKYFQTIKL